MIAVDGTLHHKQVAAYRTKVFLGLGKVVVQKFCKGIVLGTHVLDGCALAGLLSQPLISDPAVSRYGWRAPAARMGIVHDENPVHGKEELAQGLQPCLLFRAIALTLRVGLAFAAAHQSCKTLSINSFALTIRCPLYSISPIFLNLFMK